MKVIGESKEDIVVTMTKEELAKLTEFQSTYQMERTGRQIKPGMSIDIGDMFQRAQDTLLFYKETVESFKKTQNAMKRLLDLIEPPPPA